MKKLDQRSRVAALLLNVALGLTVHRCISGRWEITGTTADAWLIGICAYWTLGLVSAPFFTPPKDSLANALAALITLSTTSILSDNPAYALLALIKLFGIILSLSVLGLSIAAIATLPARETTGWSQSAYELANKFGAGSLLFTPLVMVSAFAGYRSDLPAVASIMVLWLLSISVGLFETVLALRFPAKSASSPDLLGRVQRFDNPGLMRVLLSGRAKWKSDSVVIVEMPNEKQVFALPLFEHPGVGGRIGTAVIAGGSPDHMPNVKELEAYSCGGIALRTKLIDALGGLGPDAQIAGIVVEGSSIASLRFEAVSTDLLKGQVVAVPIIDDHVYYQITDATTGEESISSEVHGRRIATAIQLGTYKDDKGFLRYDWVPQMNSCVFLVQCDKVFHYTPKSDQRSVGSLPGTRCEIFADIDEIVHYHAAILGVTGTGKTELSLDLVRGAVEERCKVVCVDFTGEYAKRLSDLSPLQLGLTSSLGRAYEEAIFAVESGQYGAGPEKAALKVFVDKIRPLIERQVGDFLSGDNQLAILELAEITNTKATLRTTELYLSAFMACAKANRRGQRILLVLEEAHTIVPETGGSGMDYDSKWVVDRIGQIALQGRKYGIGLLVVSQRTALVSKTILSQCNTFFTFTLVDQTSLGFLGSVFSNDHVTGIPNLQSLEMICYGRGINSARPILVRRRYDSAKLEGSQQLNAGSREVNVEAPCGH